MRNARRFTMMSLLFCGVLVLAAPSWAQNRPPILNEIAKTYGLDGFGQVEAIRYTWNGEIVGLFKASRAWEWEPKTGKVSFEGMKKLPVGAGSATLVSVKYGSELGGYTPGDTWNLYVGKDNRVEYLVFQHGGDKKPSLVKATW